MYIPHYDTFFIYLNQHIANLRKQRLHSSFFTEVDAFWTICKYRLQLLIIYGLYVFTAVIFSSLSLSLSASHHTVVLQDSCIPWWYQLWYLLNFVEESFVSWKLEEIYWGNLQVQFPFSTFLKLCIKSLHLATFLSHSNDMMAKNPSIFKSYWGNT